MITLTRPRLLRSIKLMHVIGTLPEDKEQDVDPKTTVLVKFDASIDPASVTADTFILEAVDGELKVTKTVPGNNATDIPVSQIIDMNFNTDIDGDTVSDKSILINLIEQWVDENGQVFDPASFKAWVTEERINAVLRKLSQA